jgi:hypothetical protein
MTKRITILILFVFCVFVYKSNAQVFQWAKQFATNYSYGTDIAVDNSFNVITSGYFADSIDINPGPLVDMRYSQGSTIVNSTSYLCKLDALGNYSWGGIYQTPKENRIISIDADNQNNILVIGQFTDSIDLDFGVGQQWVYANGTSLGTFRSVFVAKYDAAGSYIWGRQLSARNLQNSHVIWSDQIKTDLANNIIITGSFKDTVDFDPGPAVFTMVGDTTTVGLAGDKFLLKLDSNGNFIWAKKWNGSLAFNDGGYFGSHEIDIDAQGNILMPINFTGTIDIDPGSATNLITSGGATDFSIIKISPNGTLIWHKEFGNSSNNYCWGLAVDKTGNVICPLESYGQSIDLDPTATTQLFSWSNASFARLLVKLDAAGNYVWGLRNLENNIYGYSWREGIGTDTSGNIFITTKIWEVNNNQWDLDPGVGSFIVSSRGLDDIAFQKFNAAGLFVMGGVLGGNINDYNYGLCTDRANGVYLSGYFYTNCDFDPSADSVIVNSTLTGYDGFVLKLNECNFSSNQFLSSCDSLSYNNQTFYTNTLIQNIFPTANGCDSTANMNIIIHNSTTQTVALSGCDSTTFNGINYSQTGQYNQYYSSIHGCDSNYIINFTKVVVDTSVSLVGQSSLSANAVAASFQWIDCNTMQGIPGATFALFTPNYAGNFAVVVTQNGCIDTSACYHISIYPESLNDYKIRTHVYPNPSKGSYYLELDKQYTDVNLEVRNLNGQIIWSKHFDTLKETEVLFNRAFGVYMLHITRGEHKEVKKLLKW